MKEIVNRLHEKHQIELAKSILESNGYDVSELKESKLQEAESSNVDKVRSLMKELGVSIEDLQGTDHNLGKFKEFSDTDYRSYAAYKLPDGTPPLLYEGTNKFDLIISGDDDERSTDVVLSFVPYAEEYDEEYHKIFSDIEEALSEGNALIDALEVSKYAGDNLSGATSYLKSKGFKNTEEYN